MYIELIFVVSFWARLAWLGRGCQTLAVRSSRHRRTWQPGHGPAAHSINYKLNRVSCESLRRRPGSGPQASVVQGFLLHVEGRRHVVAVPVVHKLQVLQAGAVLVQELVELVRVQALDLAQGEVPDGRPHALGQRAGQGHLRQDQLLEAGEHGPHVLQGGAEAGGGDKVGLQARGGRGLGAGGGGLLALVCPFLAAILHDLGVVLPLCVRAPDPNVHDQDF
mmetsp:Transcript_39719/g.100066  ORF Transcript_39719/g.100066 Transcript_39719/m.100066 type:complete len:221 (+) Transcript_39719:867-1529(+)